ncbi:MAG: hypothetical protein KKC84_00910 [Candidatus Omnitrophica bacterium]|nr:hypothetical protein [Candidatus Omnitrophota bacterium]
MSNQLLVLLEPARVLLGQFALLGLKFLVALIILFLGWMVSRFVRTIIGKLTKPLDGLSERFGLENVLKKGGIGLTLSEVLGVIAYWFGILMTAMLAINAVGLTMAADLLNRIILFVPNVVSAVFIMIAGLFVGTFMKNIVQAAASNAGLSQGQVLSKAVEVAIIIFAIFIALEQLRIGIRITELTIGIVFGSVGLGLALAFGLGCKDIAGKLVNEFIEKLKKK